MQTTLTLDAVEQEFANWRNTRRCQTEPISQELWDQVKIISKYCKSGTIYSRLKLSGSQVKAKLI